MSFSSACKKLNRSIIVFKTTLPYYLCNIRVMTAKHQIGKDQQRTVRYIYLSLSCMIASVVAIAIIMLMSFLPKLPVIIADVIGGPITYLSFLLSGPAYLLGQYFGFSIFTLAIEKNELVIPLLFICSQWLVVWLAGISLIISERYWKVLLGIGVATYICLCIVSFATYLLIEFKM